MKTIDLFLFAGQSNMAGRGISNEQWPAKAPVLLPGAGYEFRAISDPTKLYPIEEPFGVYENNKHGIYDVFDGGVFAKTGSMVTAFCNTYFMHTHVPIVGVSAAKGGSHIKQWLPDSTEGYLPDAIERYQAAKTYLLEHHYYIRHEYLLWCQGESDGDLGTSTLQYERTFPFFWNEMKKIGIEKCFAVQIGFSNQANAKPSEQKKLDLQYKAIHNALEELSMMNSDITMVSNAFVSMREKGLMKDEFHYFQQGYNECGEDAGKAVSTIVLSDS